VPRFSASAAACQSRLTLNPAIAIILAPNPVKSSICAYRQQATVALTG